MLLFCFSQECDLFKALKNNNKYFYVCLIIMCYFSQIFVVVNNLDMGIEIWQQSYTRSIQHSDLERILSTFYRKQKLIRKMKITTHQYWMKNKYSTHKNRKHPLWHLRGCFILCWISDREKNLCRGSLPRSQLTQWFHRKLEA